MHPRLKSNLPWSTSRRNLTKLDLKSIKVQDYEESTAKLQTAIRVAQKSRWKCRFIWYLLQQWQHQKLRWAPRGYPWVHHRQPDYRPVVTKALICGAWRTVATYDGFEVLFDWWPWKPDVTFGTVRENDSQKILNKNELPRDALSADIDAQPIILPRTSLHAIQNSSSVPEHPPNVPAPATADQHTAPLLLSGHRAVCDPAQANDFIPVES